MEDKMAQVHTRYGVLAVPDLKTDLVGKFLQHYGEWAWLETLFLAPLLPKQAAILDVGAFLGTFTLGLCEQASVSSVVVVEANSVVFPMLSNNLKKNLSIKPVVLNNLVVGDISKTHFKHVGQGNFGGVSYNTEALDPQDAEIDVEATTLLALCDAYGPFDLIKLDVEGSELGILQADQEFLAKSRSTFWLECNEAPASLEVADLLLSSGFELFYFAFPSHNKNNFRKTSSVMLPWVCKARLFATRSPIPALSTELVELGCILKRVYSTEDVRLALWSVPHWGIDELQDGSDPKAAAYASHALRSEIHDFSAHPDRAGGLYLWEKMQELEAVLEKERDTFRNIIDETKREHEGLILQANLDLERVKREHAGREADLSASLQGQLVKAQQENAVKLSTDLQEQLEKAKQVYDAREAELLVSLQEQLEKAKQVYDARETEFLVVFQEQLEKAKQEYDAREAEFLVVLQKQLEKSKQEYDAREADVSASLQQKLSEISGLTEALKVSKSALAGNISAFDRLKASADEAQRRLLETEVSSLDRLAKIGNLTDELLRTNQRITQLRAQHAQLEDQNAQLESRFRQLEDQNAQLESRSRQLEDQNAQLESRSRQLEDQNAQLESRSRQLEEQNTRQDAHSQYLEGLNVQLRVELRRMEELYTASAGAHDAILRSATWRVARRVHRVVNKIPPLKKGLVLSRRAGGKLWRVLRSR